VSLNHQTERRLDAVEETWWAAVELWWQELKTSVCTARIRGYVSGSKAPTHVKRPNIFLYSSVCQVAEEGRLLSVTPVRLVRLGSNRKNFNLPMSLRVKERNKEWQRVNVTHSEYDECLLIDHEESSNREMNEGWN